MTKVFYVNKSNNKRYALKDTSQIVELVNELRNVNRLYTLIDVNTAEELIISEEEIRTKFVKQNIILG
ncbi:MAG TPA: hypothetical protein PLY35_08275 [Thermotogota bacterium]|nr:hypothetical protein [Thermotogota bacterium]